MKREISKHEVMNLLLEACPSYKQYYEVNLDDDGEQLLYIDIMEREKMGLESLDCEEMYLR